MTRIYTNGEGYEFFRAEHGGKTFYHHRLVAIAEYGIDAVKATDDVHHRELWDGRSVPFINGRDLVVPEDWVEHRKRTLAGVEATADTAPVAGD